MNVASKTVIFLAAKRQHRMRLPKDWQDTLKQIDGVEIVNASEFRAQITTTPSGLRQVKQLLSDFFLIEEPIERNTL